MNEGTSEYAGEVDDSWAQILAKLETERSKTRAQEVTGRGAKRKAAPSFLPEVCVSLQVTSVVGSWISQQNLDIVIGSGGSSAENSPERSKKKKGKKKLLDREDYNASAHSSDVDSGGGTDAGSVAPDDLLVDLVKKTKKRGLTSAIVHDYEDKLHENYCGLCGTIHLETCHMVQNPDTLVKYRAMLMEVTNEEPIGIRVSCMFADLYIWVLTGCAA